MENKKKKHKKKKKHHKRTQNSKETQALLLDLLQTRELTSKILLVALAVHTQHCDFLYGLVISFQVVQNAVILGYQVL